jgi:SAM-dependent methyltransferase
MIMKFIRGTYTLGRYYINLTINGCALWRFKNNHKPFINMNKCQKEAKKRILSSLVNREYKQVGRKKCICNGNDFYKICKKDRFALPFGVILCKNCGLLQTSPRLASSNLPLFYERDYHELILGKNEFEPNRDLTFENKGVSTIKYILPHLNVKDGINIAEVGCGTGSVLGNIKLFLTTLNPEYEINCYGCDYSEKMVDTAKKNKSLKVVKGGIESLKLLNVEFDLIILSHVVEHIIEFDEFFNELRDVIKPETLIYIEVPGVFSLHDIRNDWTIYDFNFLKYFTFAHIWHFSLNTLEYHMNRNNFIKIVGDEYVHSIFQYKKGNVPLKKIKFLALSTLSYLYRLETFRKCKEKLKF